ncbi:MAG: FkbM family methyltransferase [Lentisphaeria bacterium]|nr:FkbM family methyltransferase [Lentisphaeria bacterium]
MTDFLFNSEFRQQLQESAHHYGEVAFLESVLRPGMTTIEGGANRGVTAIAMAMAVGSQGHVHAFEPVPEFFATLEENISRNNIGNTSVYNLALSNQAGSISFYKHGTGSGVTFTDDGEAIEVEAITIPEFLAVQNIPSLDFINLDCEGSELLVLQSAQDVLTEQAPPIFCEVHRGYLEALGQSVAELAKYLAGLGYDVKPIQVEDLKSPSDFDHCSHIYAA